MQPWLERDVLFFGGKGGVGKTTCATAFALLASEAGKRTLMVSTDPAHSTSDILQRQLDDQPQRLSEHLWALEIDAEREAEAYISGVQEHLRRVVKPALRGEVERQVEMARVSPGAEEAALFDRIAALMQELGSQYDLIIFDTAPHRPHPALVEPARADGSLDQRDDPAAQAGQPDVADVAQRRRGYPRRGT